MDKRLMELMLANPLAKAGFIIIATIFILAMLAPIIAPYDPNAFDVKAILLAPSWQHWMGTDGLGRDVLSRMLYGGRISLLVGMLSIPSFFLILAVIAFLTPSIINIMIVIGLTSWMGVTRLVRAEFLSLNNREFILASRTLGAKDARLIFKHLLPNSLTPIIVSAVLGVAGAVLMESGLRPGGYLSFLAWPF